MADSQEFTVPYSQKPTTGPFRKTEVCRPKVLCAFIISHLYATYLVYFILLYLAILIIFGEDDYKGSHCSIFHILFLFIFIWAQ
jgi:hypothetical protein